MGSVSHMRFVFRVYLALRATQPERELRDEIGRCFPALRDYVHKVHGTGRGLLNCRDSKIDDRAGGRSNAPLEAERDGYIQGWRAENSQKLAEANGRINDAGSR